MSEFDTKFIENCGLVGVSHVDVLERLASYAESPSHTGPLDLNLLLVARNVSGAVEALFPGPEHSQFVGRIHELAKALTQSATLHTGITIQGQLSATLRDYAKKCDADA